MKKNLVYTVCKTMEIAGAHRLQPPYESKCSNLHGHNWLVRVWCKTFELNEAGMVVDFTHVKKEIHDRLDHQNLNALFDFNPTAENMAAWMLDRLSPHGAFKVEIQESPPPGATCLGGERRTRSRTHRKQNRRQGRLGRDSPPTARLESAPYPARDRRAGKKILTGLTGFTGLKGEEGRIYGDSPRKGDDLRAGGGRMGV